MKLTLRDLFWLVLVCGMGLGWWVNRSSQNHKWQKLREAIGEAGYSIDTRDGSSVRQTGHFKIIPHPKH